MKRRGVIPVSNVSTGPRLVTMEEAKRRLGQSDAGGAGAAEETGAREAKPEPNGG